MKNIFKTTALLVVMTLLLMGIGELVGGPRGMMFALMLAVVINFASYWFSDSIVLAMYKARDPQGAELAVETTVNDLAKQAGLPMPRVKIIDTNMPNAFATGRNPNHAVVAVTTGLLHMLNKEELIGVLAHELSHVRNRDILIGAIAATMAGAISMIARLAFFFGGDRDRNPIAGLALMIVAPIAAMLIQMAVSRSREYAADRSAGLLTGRPQDLIAALEKLHNSATRHPIAADAQGNATAHLFIVNPFKSGGLASLFSTHPSLEQRKANLLNVAREINNH